MQIFVSQPVIVKVDSAFTLQIGNWIRNDYGVLIFGKIFWISFSLEIVLSAVSPCLISNPASVQFVREAYP